MTARIHAHGWHCTVPGCLKCGAGYGSEITAARARRHHEQTAHLTLTQRAGVAR